MKRNQARPELHQDCGRPLPHARCARHGDCLPAGAACRRCQEHALPPVVVPASNAPPGGAAHPEARKVKALRGILDRAQSIPVMRFADPRGHDPRRCLPAVECTCPCAYCARRCRGEGAD